MVMRDRKTDVPLGVLVWAEITFNDRSGPKGKLYQASSETEVSSFIERIFRIDSTSYRQQLLDWNCLSRDMETDVVPIVLYAVTP